MLDDKFTKNHYIVVARFGNAVVKNPRDKFGAPMLFDSIKSAEHTCRVLDKDFDRKYVVVTLKEYIKNVIEKFSPPEQKFLRHEFARQYGILLNEQYAPQEHGQN